ncbi:MAG: AI-2E family transporter [Alphaproteobacteria bacterium]|jgi:predicted PurR-regulated permease PerM|nr:AI-2E family transporter [Rhodospirillaceae bacterium]MBT6510233.1 AI-2E family transporter [Rhodospirillaceae bacterium]MBT7614635.1 AI-2E family transporter [Rhodospirillaceae bacterium]MDG2481823.1 AI-2E family transporter [Alphaproteobacteria bacterium]
MNDSTNRTAGSISVDVLVTLAPVGLFAYLSMQLVMPFLTILAWSAILAISLYPVFRKMQGWLGGRASLAALAFSLIGLLILLVPTYLVGDSLVGSLVDLSNDLRDGNVSLPPPDEAVKDWPLIGDKVYGAWHSASTNLAAMLEKFAPELQHLSVVFLKIATGLVVGVLQFALSIVFAAVFMYNAASLCFLCERIAVRISASQGVHYVKMASATIRNVARGVVGVAIIQGGLASIGYFVAGFPLAGFVSAVTFLASIVQAPPLVMIPAIIYMWSAESTTTALIFTAYMLPVMFCDNILKPILMARGLETPMIVILIGVIGGTLSGGLLGLFIGPVVLALFYKMIQIWTGIDKAPEPVEIKSSES